MPEDAAPEAGAASTTEAAAPEADLFDNPELTSFPRDYVEKLRRESQGLRESTKPVKEAFEGWDDNSKTGFLNLAQMLVQNPTEAAKVMRNIADELSPAEVRQLEKAIDQAEADADDEGAPVDVEATVEAKIKEYEQKREMDSAIERVLSEADKLGYGQDKGPDHLAFMWIANNQTNGDLAKAAEAMKQREQSIIERYLSDKQASNDAHITPTSGTTPPPADANKNLTARERLEARLERLSSGAQ